MDPLTALGAASGVVQLLDFASEIIQQSYNLIKTTKNWPRQHAKITDLHDLSKELCERLTKELNTHYPLNEDEDLLRRTVETSRDNVDSLCSLLESLTIAKNADESESIGKKIASGVKAHFNRGAIESHIQELERSQKQLSSVLLQLIRSALPT
jgi:hypothetical protein